MGKPTDGPDAAVAIRRAKIRRRRVIGALALIAVIAVAAYFIVGKLRVKSNDLGNLALAKVERASITQTISATGTVTPQTGYGVNIGSQITGRIKRLDADVGSKVSASQIIAELDLPDVEAQFESSKANLESAKQRLYEQQSGLGLQRTTVTTDLATKQANLDSAQRNYKQAVQNATLQVKNAEAAIRQTQANADNAKKFLERQKQLLAKGYVAQQDVDNQQAQYDVYIAQLDSGKQSLELTRSQTETAVRTAQNTLTNAKQAMTMSQAGVVNNDIKLQQIADAKAAVRQATSGVAVAKAQYDKTMIRTPIPGTVVALDVQQGETIAAGLSAPTLIRVVNLKKLQVDVFVDESDIGSVRLGQRATITVDAYPNRVFQGHVTKVASGATMQGNVVTYDTTIAVENQQDLLRPDMTATAKILVGSHNNVLTVPIEAVKFGKDGQTVDILVRGKVAPQRVVAGASDDTHTEILRGLAEGQTIVLAGGQSGGPGFTMSPFGPMAGGRQGGGAGGGGAGGGGGRSGGGGAGR
jgi:HlyD family secretion protein